jgi:IS30 family transposase
MLRTTPRQSHLTQATKAKILQAYSMRQTQASIAKELNIPSSTIRSVLWRANERSKPHKINAGHNSYKLRKKQVKSYIERGI